MKPITCDVDLSKPLPPHWDYYWTTVMGSMFWLGCQISYFMAPSRDSSSALLMYLTMAFMLITAISILALRNHRKNSERLQESVRVADEQSARIRILEDSVRELKTANAALV